MNKNKNNISPFEVLDGNDIKTTGFDLKNHEIKDLVNYLVLQKVKLRIQSEEINKLKNKLEIARDHYSELYQLNPVSYFTLSLDGKVIDANFSALVLLSVKLDNLLGENFIQYVPQKFRNSFYEHCKNLNDSNLVENFEIKLTDRNNSEFYVQVLATVSYDPQHNKKNYRIAVRNIDERKKLHRKLEKYQDNIDKLSSKKQDDDLKSKKSKAKENKSPSKPVISGQQGNIKVDKNLQLKNGFDNIICQSREINEVLQKVERVAATDMTVLIEGETGTGKELIARALYALSKRRERPLVKVDCTTLPSNLMESELFGHEKGAFTGAFNKKFGRFELANKGTIFLDEIGELPLETQSKLLRFLQEKKFERVGSAKTLKVDTRVIAATNRDLKNEIEKGNFREDLYYRLNVYPIYLPPLRERTKDIPILTKYFINMFNKKLNKDVTKIPKSCMNKLMQYSWPGNVRELKNIIERAILTSPDDKLILCDLLSNEGSKDILPGNSKTLQQIEKEYILNILNSTNWKIGGKKGAAEILGVKRTTLYEKMKKLGISKNHS